MLKGIWGIGDWGLDVVELIGKLQSSVRAHYQTDKATTRNQRLRGGMRNEDQ
jgi:hypothetical protein